VYSNGRGCSAWHYFVTFSLANVQKSIALKLVSGEKKVDLIDNNEEIPVVALKDRELLILFLKFTS
jgi:hypothetical protein